MFMHMANLAVTEVSELLGHYYDPRTDMNTPVNKLGFIYTVDAGPIPGTLTRTGRPSVTGHNPFIPRGNLERPTYPTHRHAFIK